MNHKKLCILLFACTIAYAFLVEPYAITVERVNIPSTQLSRVLQGKTAVHISDLHIGRFGKREEKLISILSKLKPDLIFITGDLCSWQEKDFSGFLEFIKQVNSRLGVFVILGDADYSHKNKMCILCHIKNSKILRKWKNFQVLRNETLKITIQKKELLICALDPESKYDSEEKKRNVIINAPQDTPMILLDHAFKGFKYYGQRPNLILSGNTHGGQVHIPFLQNYLMEKVGHKTAYLSGLFKKNDVFLYVNRGIGTSKLPVRFLCPPEVTVFTFY